MITKQLQAGKTIEAWAETKPGFRFIQSLVSEAKTGICTTDDLGRDNLLVAYYDVVNMKLEPIATADGIALVAAQSDK